MKIFKSALLSTLFISSASFAANNAPQEQVTLSSLLEVLSFCNSGKSCTSITPVINKGDLDYSVQYSTDDDSAPDYVDPTDGGNGGDDD